MCKLRASATLPLSGTVLVITNFFSKWLEAFPLQSTDSENLGKQANL